MSSESVLSSRGLYINDHPSFMFQNSGQVNANLYHPTDNPKGVINLGTADNGLCNDLLTRKMKEKLQVLPHHQFYPSTNRVIKVKEDITSFLNDFFQPAQKLDRSNLVMYNGVGPLLVGLANILAEAGEYFITPAPFYSQFKVNFQYMSGVKTCFINQKDKRGDINNSFQLTAEMVDEAITEAKSEGKVVRAFVLSNPSNPLGDVYSAPLLLDILKVCKKHKIHAIIDEIYALSVFGEDAKFESILSLPDLPDPARTHFLWGASKDLALSGMRLGVLYSRSKEVVAALNMQNYFFYTPPLVAEAFTAVLNDRKWLQEKYFPENRRRMKYAYVVAKTGLEEMGVKVRPSQAGLFLWADFSSVLPRVTAECEMDLFGRLLKEGVYVIPGSSLSCPAPGWIRLVFTHAHMRPALTRIAAVIGDVKKGGRGRLASRGG